jgi:23S rRNA pseudouridine1911/1915/1917 synthase
MALQPEEPSILYSHRGIAVVLKPSGLPSQPARQDVPDLYSLLCERLGYVGLHHRLDRPASGLLIVTTDRRWNAAVAEAFRKKRIQRSYLVAVLGDPGEAGRWDMAVDGREACTHWRRESLGTGISVLEATLETGRTHQIRRHAAGQGHPVLGDRRYGGAAGRLWPRLALHAHRLVFEHPATGEEISIEAPPTGDISVLLGSSTAPQGSSEI